MALDLTQHNEVILTINDMILQELFAGSDTKNVTTPVPGVKGHADLTVYGEGSATINKGIGGAPSGDLSSLKTVRLTVEDFYINTPFMKSQLDKHFSPAILAPGANNEYTRQPAHFFDGLVMSEIAAIAKGLEMNYWQGDSSLVSGYNMFDGYLLKLEADADVIKSLDQAAITSANVIEVVEGIRDLQTNVDVKESDDFIVMVGNDVFELYQRAIQSEGNRWRNPEDQAGEISLISGGKVKRVRGLHGTGTIVAGLPKNFHRGFDAENDSQFIEFVEDKTNMGTLMQAKYRAGVAITNGKETVLRTTL